MSYTRLFSSIVTSTIWTEDSDTCKVWVTLLALADKRGQIHASLPGLAQVASVPLSKVKRAIAKFLSPDEHSRSRNDEGRRLREIDGGWELVNHAKYRRAAARDEACAAGAKRQARFRARKKNDQGLGRRSSDSDPT